MSCNVCENNYGYTNGCECSFLMCKSCSEKTCGKKDKCPQCGKSIKTPYFLSGKIQIKSKGGSNYDIESRLIVYDDDMDDKKDVMNNLAGSKHGIVELHTKEQLIEYSNFIHLDKSLPIRKINTFVGITGPCIIINGEVECAHGSGVNGDYDDWSTLYRDISSIRDIVEKRNKEMIDKCRVFSLKVNSDNNCFCSFSEWGYALSMNKTLTLDISKNNPQLKEYYMYAIQSLNSLDKLTFTRKHSIIKYHPELEFDDYNSYREYMMYIISLK
jgi:hypothetical protein